MADENNTTEMVTEAAQDSAAVVSEQTTSATETAQSGDLQAQLEALRAEQARTAAALKAANAEAAKRRKDLEAFELAEQKRKEAEMSELERAKAEADRIKKELEKATLQYGRMAIESALVAEAARLNFADPNDVVTLLASEIETGEDGKPQAVSEKVEALSKSKPYLLKQKPKQPQLSTTNPDGQTVQQGETEAQKKQRIFGHGIDNPFSPDFASKSGGGVYRSGAKDQ